MGVQVLEVLCKVRENSWKAEHAGKLKVVTGIGCMWGKEEEGDPGCDGAWKGSRRAGRNVPGPDKGHNAEIVHPSCCK